MRAAGVVLVLLVAVSLVAAKDMSHELDEIENIDSSVFNTDAGLVSASPIEQAAAAVVSARDADLDADTEAVAALAAESGAGLGAASDEGAMYSFRAMRHATELAGSSISVGEKASETHAAAMRILKGSKRVSADELFLEINREQQILAAKRALVARQKQSIADSEESLQRLKRLIGDNKSILAKNEHALRRASDDLLQLISKYQAKLRAGITKEVGGTADTPAGQPMRSRPHQRAAYTKWAPRGQRKVDTTKSKVALAAANAKGTTDKAEASAKAARVPHVPAHAKADASAAAARKPSTPPHAKAEASAKAARAAANKMKFAEANAEETETVADEAAAEVAAEEAAAEHAEAESEESEAEESEDEEEETDESESESEEEDESEESEESESDESDESESEESADALLESGAAVDLTVSREAVLAGLAPPPHLYDETADAFVF